MKDRIKPKKKKDLVKNEKEITENFDSNLEDGQKSYKDEENQFGVINKDAAFD